MYNDCLEPRNYPQPDESPPVDGSSLNTYGPVHPPFSGPFHVLDLIAPPTLPDATAEASHSTDIRFHLTTPTNRVEYNATDMILNSVGLMHAVVPSSSRGTKTRTRAPKNDNAPTMPHIKIPTRNKAWKCPLTWYPGSTSREWELITHIFQVHAFETAACRCGLGFRNVLERQYRQEAASPGGCDSRLPETYTEEVLDNDVDTSQPS